MPENADSMVVFHGFMKKCCQYGRFSMVSALGASWGSLGTFLAHLVGLLVALGASLGPCWDRLGGCWVPLGGCWRLFGSLLACAGSFWLVRGAPLGDHLGPLGWVISLRVRISLLEMKFSCYLKMVGDAVQFAC